LATLALFEWSIPKARADEKIGRAWAAAWNSHRADAVAALFTADGVYEDVPTAAVNRGRAEIRAFAQFYFTAVPDLKITLVKSHVKGGHGSIEWIFSGTDKGVFGTGKKFAVRGATVLDLRGGKIVRNSDYWDLATVLRQLGLLSSPGKAAKPAPAGGTIRRKR
jgi:steroid delta-isomerase-like uncharacterized protein